MLAFKSTCRASVRILRACVSLLRKLHNLRPRYSWRYLARRLPQRDLFYSDVRHDCHRGCHSLSDYIATSPALLAAAFR